MSRRNNYDLLRVISTIAVIAIHVSSKWYRQVAEDVIELGMAARPNHPMAIAVWNLCARFAVPCFLMLSGAFLLDNSDNQNYRSFYYKSFQKIGVPTLVFSILYVLYQIPICLLSGGVAKLTKLALEVFKGAPMYHMWYLYMLIGVYALVPLTVRFKESITEGTFHKVALVFFILANISLIMSKGVELEWDVGRSFEYLSYFMLGYSIQKNTTPNNLRAVLAVGFGIMLELCAAFFAYHQMIRGITYGDTGDGSTKYYMFLITIASVLIFYGFSCMRFEKKLSDLSKLTFYIYLIHAGVWDVILKIFKIVCGDNYLTAIDSRWGIPVGIVVVLFLSILLSRCYLWLDGKIRTSKQMSSCM